MDLNYILEPVINDKFFEDYWEKEILYLDRNDKRYFEGLFSIDDLDIIVASGHLRYPSLKLSKDGLPLDKAQYTLRSVQRGGDTFDFEVDIDAVHRYYTEGATIRLMALEKNWMSTINLKNVLEQQLGHTVQINAYLTPPNSSGIALHYDPHDVFVLQISGEKDWLVYNSPYKLPLPNDVIRKQPDELLLDTTLMPGGVLYIPRGFYHVAKTTKSHSLHLTIGLKVIRVVDVLRSYLDHLLTEKSQELQFRKSLSPNLIGSKEARKISAEVLESCLSDLLQDFDSMQGIERAVETFRESQSSHGKLFFRANLEDEM